MKNKIISILINELKYSEHVAEITANDLVNIHEKLKPIIQKWINNREITNVEVDGFSISELMKNRNYTFPSAIISIDWLLTEPDVAKKALSEKIRR